MQLALDEFRAGCNAFAVAISDLLGVVADHEVGIIRGGAGKPGIQKVVEALWGAGLLNTLHWLGRGDDLRGLIGSRGGLGRRRELGVAIEDDGIEELVVFAGGLGAAGLFVHLAADLHDHIGDGAAGGGDGIGEDGGEEAILCLAAGFRCEDDDGVFRLGLDDGEPARGGAGGGRQGIIAAGIEHDDVCRGAGGVEGGHDFIELDRAGGDAFFIGDVGIGGDEVVAAIHLHAVAAVVEEGDAA